MRTNGGVDPVVFVMDSNLKLVQTFTLAQMTAWTYDGIGNFPMMNAEGNVEISNIAFSAGNFTTAAGPSWVGHPTVQFPGFGSPNANMNDINFTMAGGNSLTYSQWNWFYPSIVFNSAAVLVNGAGGNYNVLAVYDVDDTPAAGEVVLVLSDMSNNMYLVAIPLFNILNNTVATPLFSSYPSTTLTNFSSSSIGFPGDSFVAYNYNSNSLVRYSAKPPFNQLNSLSMGNNSGKNNGNLKYAYKMTGGYSVVYDQVARTLTKVANWW